MPKKYKDWIKISAMFMVVIFIAVIFEPLILLAGVIAVFVGFFVILFKSMV